MAMIDETAVGRCSICGGEVVVPNVIWSVKKPVPQCRRCGAVAKPRGPVIEMQPIERLKQFPY